MSIKNTGFITFVCDGPSCPNTTTFEQKDAQEAFKEVAWLKTGRVIQTNDQRQFYYCSDECEINGITEGTHNQQEAKPKLVTIQGGVDAAIKQAAAQAAAQEAATKAIKNGQPASVTLG